MGLRSADDPAGIVTWRNVMLVSAIVLAVAASWSTYRSSAFEEFTATAATKKLLVEQHLNVSSTFVNFLAKYGTEYFDEDVRTDDALYSLLRYNPETDRFDLDGVAGMEAGHHVGNLTGLGRIPDSGSGRAEVNMALRFNGFFDTYFAGNPDVAWLYYTSERGFINMYPWVASGEFFFEERLKAVPFYSVATPAANPSRSAVWTPAYRDEAGKGMMVTLSAPVYDGNAFRGVVSLDLTNAWFSEVLKNKFESYIIDGTGSVIAASGRTLPRDSVVKLGDITSLPGVEHPAMKDRKIEGIHAFGGNYIYPVPFESVPWTMYFIVPQLHVYGKVTVSILPVLFISVLLLVVIRQMEIRRKSALALKNERELLKTTLLSLNEAIFVTDSSGRITMMNDFACEFTGWPEEEARGRPFGDVFHNLDLVSREKAPDPVRAVLETGKDVETKEHTGIVSRDGVERFIFGSAAGIKSDSGSLSGVIVSVRDTTREYEQEKEIEAFLNVNLDFLCVVDREGTLRRANREFLTLIGIGQDEMRGKNFLEFVHEDDRPAAIENMKSLLEHKSVQGFTCRFRTRGNAWRYLEWRALPATGTYFYASARDVTETVQREEKLVNLAVKDQLTGLYNRHFLESIIDREMALSDRTHSPVSMIMLDLDHFKDVNDNYGHPVGDELLKLTAEITERNLRVSDILIRFGGEEFIVILPNTSQQGAVVTAQKIRTALEAADHPVTGRRTASFGVAERMEGEPFESWYRRTDEAIYRAKDTGRNRVVAADVCMSPLAEAACTDEP